MKLQICPRVTSTRILERQEYKILIVNTLQCTVYPKFHCCHVFMVQVEEESREIERIHLNPEEASERFRGKYLDGAKVDFSDRIARSRRKGYDALTHWELAAAGEPETAFQKFLRLKVCLFLRIIMNESMCSCLIYIIIIAVRNSRVDKRSSDQRIRGRCW